MFCVYGRDFTVKRLDSCPHMYSYCIVFYGGRWGNFLNEYLRELYEEGLLVSGMIVKTEPLTIMAIANMVAQEGTAAVNGCYCLEVKALDGARKELFEKIPCSCFSATKGASTIRPFSPTLFTGVQWISRRLERH